MYGLTARVEPSSNFAIGADRFIQLIENKYTDLKPTVHTQNRHESIHFPSIAILPPTPQILSSSVPQACCLCLDFFIPLPQNKGQRRQEKEPLKSTVGKSDPCWMNEDTPAGHWPREKEKNVLKLVLLEGEKKCFCLCFFKHSLF